MTHLWCSVLFRSNVLIRCCGLLFGVTNFPQLALPISTNSILKVNWSALRRVTGTNVSFDAFLSVRRQCEPAKIQQMSISTDLFTHKWLIFTSSPSMGIAVFAILNTPDSNVLNYSTSTDYLHFPEYLYSPPIKHAELGVFVQLWEFRHIQ